MTLQAVALSGLRRLVLAGLGLGLVIGAWWLLALGTDPIRLPPPDVVWETFLADFDAIPALQFVAFQEGGIGDALVFTTTNVLLGVALGSAIGFPLGALLGRVRVARDLLEPPLIVASTIPVLTLAPFLVIWFGTGRIVQSGMVILFSLVTVAAVTQQATQQVGERYTQYASSLGAGQRAILRYVVLPAVVPAAVGAVRVALAAGWSFATVAELLGGNAGIGKLVQTMQGISATADIIAAVLALGVVAVLVDAVVTAAGRFLVRWQE